jgi:PIN domain nuclease of toxin-antitoxin system
VDVGSQKGESRICGSPGETVILLDTHALIWLHQGHRRARPLLEKRTRIFASPASLLELAVLVEVGRLRLRGRATIEDVFADERWLVDEPPAGAWFGEALRLAWTRDPYDRLLAAHALVRGWKLATADAIILEHLPAPRVFEL